MNTETRKGDQFGECQTVGCHNVARWIPVSHPPTMPQPFRFYCPSCCDSIAAAREMVEES